MKAYKFYSAGHTDALEYAKAALEHKGCAVAANPDGSVTHLLLDVPNKTWDALPGLLRALPENVTVIGGNLQHSALENHKVVDLLQDPLYLAENANITAHCAVKLALKKLPVILYRCPVLVIGWGRIGKCLASLLKQMGAYVTVAARKETDRAMLSALGYDTEDTGALSYGLIRYRLIFNTVPASVLNKHALQYCSADCLKYELASLAGIEGDDVISARGLPNLEAPESSGELIARTILRLI